MRMAEGRGPDLPSAIEAALEELGEGRENVQIRVLSNPRGGEVLVSVRALASQPDPAVAELARSTLERLVATMGIQARVTVRSSTDPVILDVSGRDLGLLIGWRGGHLRALQLVTSAMLQQHLSERRLVIDVEGYRQRREVRARDLALRAARQVRASGDAIELDPMPAFERRMVHAALQDDHAVSTYSVGAEPERRVVIEPRPSA